MHSACLYIQPCQASPHSLATRLQLTPEAGTSVEYFLCFHSTSKFTSFIFVPRLVVPGRNNHALVQMLTMC